MTDEIWTSGAAGGWLEGPEKGGGRSQPRGLEGPEKKRKKNKDKRN